jgi:hypothetical protein
MKRHLLIVPLFLVNCSSPTMPPPVSPIAETPKAPPTPPVKEGPVDVKMRVLAMTSVNPDPHEIMNGEALKSGDKVAITVKVDQPAYIYVAKAPSDGTTTLIYPDSGDVQIAPDNLVHIPREGRWFKLDQHTGQEKFFVYAAKQAIPRATLDDRIKFDAAAVKISARVRPTPPSTSSIADPKPNLAPGPGGIERDVVVDGEDPSGSVGSDGVTRRRFTILHHK